MKISIKYISEASELLQDVFNLSDRNTQTLGMLPYSAFSEYANRNQIICAINEIGEFCGYLLYRISYRKKRVVIVHLCVDEKFRGYGVAKVLIKELKVKSKKFLGIQLSCRSDFPVNKVWYHFNFQAIYEKSGRSIKGSLLTVWYFNNQHPNLFSNVNKNEEESNILAVIDSNIFFDITEERKNSSSALVEAPWLQDEVTFCVTPELLNDIARNRDEKIREKNRKLFKKFKEIEFQNLDFEKVYDELKSCLYFETDVKNTNSEGDVKQLAYTIASKIKYFITGDKALLSKKEIIKKFDLNIYEAEEFLVLIDEILRKEKYTPVALAGSNLEKKSLTHDKLKEAEIYNSFSRRTGSNVEKKKDFDATIRELIIDKSKFESYYITNNNKSLALMFFKIESKILVKISFLRITNSPLKKSLAKHLLSSINEKCEQNSVMLIELSEKIFDSELQNAFQDLYFECVASSYIRVCIKKILSLKDLVHELKSLSLSFPQYKFFFDYYINFAESNIENYEQSAVYNLERRFFPLKIKELDIPCFIVPIKPRWASELFEFRFFEEKLDILKSNAKLVLNSHNVYYRAAHPKILESPSRILWYLSQEGGKKSSSFNQIISATSYIDDVVCGKAEEIFYRFKEIGIYQKKDIKLMDKNGIEGNIMAFVFSETELSIAPIRLNEIKKIFFQEYGKQFNPISPLKIENELFLRLYSQMNYKDEND